MKLKLALLATTAVGAVTAGGIAYATVGNSMPSTEGKAKAVADAADQAVNDAKAKVPAAPAVPTCLPSVPKGEHKLPKAKSHHIVKKHLPKAHEPSLPATPQAPVSAPSTLPQAPASVPSAKPSELPKAPAGVPSAKASELPKTPANLPTCVPSVPKPGTQSAQQATPAKPDLPKAPEVQQPSCDKVPPAITLQKSQAKDLTLPNGMHLAFAHTHTITVAGRQVCENVEKFAGTGGSFLTVERVQTPPKATLRDVAAALNMPQGKAVSVGGAEAWQNPLGTGMVWVSDQGYAVALSSSPDLAGQLSTIAAQLQHTK